LDFNNWTYTQKIRLIKICDKYIRERSQQGKHSDLAAISTCDQNENDLLVAERTCAQNNYEALSEALTYAQSESKPKPADKLDRLYIRNIIAGQLAIFTVALAMLYASAREPSHRPRFDRQAASPAECDIPYDRSNCR
jgi:hypothetical protein